MKKITELRRLLLKALKPPPNMTVSQWANAYRILPSENAEPGHWRTSRVEYMRAVMDCLTDNRINRVVVKSSAQVGKSEVLLNILGRTAHLAPANCMIIQPTLSDAMDFRKAA